MSAESAAFALEILTPTGALPPRRLRFLDVPAEGGRLTVLPRHQPLICLLRAGEVVTRDEAGSEERWRIDTGTLTVGRAGVTLLTPRIESTARRR